MASQAASYQALLRLYEEFFINVSSIPSYVDQYESDEVPSKSSRALDNPRTSSPSSSSRSQDSGHSFGKSPTQSKHGDGLSVPFGAHTGGFATLGSQELAEVAQGDPFHHMAYDTSSIPGAGRLSPLELDGGFTSLFDRRALVLQRYLATLSEAQISAEVSMQSGGDPLTQHDSSTSQANTPSPAEPVQNILPVSSRWAVRSMFPIIESVTKNDPKHAVDLKMGLVDILKKLLDGSQFPCLGDEPLEVIAQLASFMTAMLSNESPSSANSDAVAPTKQQQTEVASVLLSTVLHRGSLSFVLSSLGSLLELARNPASPEFLVPARAYQQLLSTSTKHLQSEYSGLMRACHRGAFPHYRTWNDSTGFQKAVSSAVPYSLGRPGTPSSIACGGSFVYAHLPSRHTLLKVGTGHGNTIAGHVYAVNEKFCEDNSGPLWLVAIRKHLYYRTMTMKDHLLEEIDTDTLRVKPKSDVVLAPETDHESIDDFGAVFTDGRSLFFICHPKPRVVPDAAQEAAKPVPPPKTQKIIDAAAKARKEEAAASKPKSEQPESSAVDKEEPKPSTSNAESPSQDGGESSAEKPKDGGAGSPPARKAEAESKGASAPDAQLEAGSEAAKVVAGKPEADSKAAKPTVSHPRIPRIDADSENWRANIDATTKLDVLDSLFKWYSCSVISTTPNSISVHYDGWGNQYDQTLPRSSCRILPYLTYASSDAKVGVRMTEAHFLRLRGTGKYQFRHQFMSSKDSEVGHESQSKSSAEQARGGASSQSAGASSPVPSSAASSASFSHPSMFSEEKTAIFKVDFSDDDASLRTLVHTKTYFTPRIPELPTSLSESDSMKMQYAQQHVYTTGDHLVVVHTEREETEDWVICQSIPLLPAGSQAANWVSHSFPLPGDKVQLEPRLPIVGPLSYDPRHTLVWSYSPFEMSFHRWECLASFRGASTSVVESSSESVPSTDPSLLPRKAEASEAAKLGKIADSNAKKDAAATSSAQYSALAAAGEDKGSSSVTGESDVSAKGDDSQPMDLTDLIGASDYILTVIAHLCRSGLYSDFRSRTNSLSSFAINVNEMDSLLDNVLHMLDSTIAKGSAGKSKVNSAFRRHVSSIQLSVLQILDDALSRFPRTATTDSARASLLHDEERFSKLRGTLLDIAFDAKKRDSLSDSPSPSLFEDESSRPFATGDSPYSDKSALLSSRGSGGARSFARSNRQSPRALANSILKDHFTLFWATVNEQLALLSTSMSTKRTPMTSDWVMQCLCASDTFLRIWTARQGKTSLEPAQPQSNMSAQRERVFDELLNFVFTEDANKFLPQLPSSDVLASASSRFAPNPSPGMRLVKAIMAHMLEDAAAATSLSDVNPLFPVVIDRILAHCKKIALHATPLVNGDSVTHIAQALCSTAVGILLPGLISGLSGAQFNTGVRIENSLLELLRSLSALNSSLKQPIKPAVLLDGKSDRNVECAYVLESPHPMNPGLEILPHEVAVQGASSLVVTFDRRCDLPETKGEMQLGPTKHHLNSISRLLSAQSQRKLQFGPERDTELLDDGVPPMQDQANDAEEDNGDDGAEDHSFVPWHQRQIFIKGNKVFTRWAPTAEAAAASRAIAADSSDDPPEQASCWGFRMSVHAHFASEPLSLPWLVDTEASLAALAARITEARVFATAKTGDVLAARWLDGGLFQAGRFEATDDSGSPSEPKDTDREFLASLLGSSAEDDSLSIALSKSPGRPLMSESSRKLVAPVERSALCALLHYANPDLVETVREVVEDKGASAEKSLIETLGPLWPKLHTIVRWALEQLQLEKRWAQLKEEPLMTSVEDERLLALDLSTLNLLIERHCAGDTVTAESVDAARTRVFNFLQSIGMTRKPAVKEEKKESASSTKDSNDDAAVASADVNGNASADVSSGANVEAAPKANDANVDGSVEAAVEEDGAAGDRVDGGDSEESSAKKKSAADDKSDNAKDVSQTESKKDESTATDEAVEDVEEKGRLKSSLAAAHEIPSESFMSLIVDRCRVLLSTNGLPSASRTDALIDEAVQFMCDNNMSAIARSHSPGDSECKSPEEALSLAAIYEEELRIRELTAREKALGFDFLGELLDASRNGWVTRPIFEIFNQQGALMGIPHQSLLDGCKGCGSSLEKRVVDAFGALLDNVLPFVGTDFHISLAIYAMRFVVKMVPFEARFSSLLTQSKLIDTIFEFEKTQCEACQSSQKTDSTSELIREAWFTGMQAVILLLKTFSWSSDGTQSDAAADELYSLHCRILAHLFRRLEDERVASSKVRDASIASSACDRYLDFIHSLRNFGSFTRYVGEVDKHKAAGVSPLRTLFELAFPAELTPTLQSKALDLFGDFIAASDPSAVQQALSESAVLSCSTDLMEFSMRYMNRLILSRHALGPIQDGELETGAVTSKEEKTADQKEQKVQSPSDDQADLAQPSPVASQYMVIVRLPPDVKSPGKFIRDRYSPVFSRQNLARFLKPGVSFKQWLNRLLSTLELRREASLLKSQSHSECRTLAVFLAECGVPVRLETVQVCGDAQRNHGVTSSVDRTSEQPSEPVPSGEAALAFVSALVEFVRKSARLPQWVLPISKCLSRGLSSMDELRNALSNSQQKLALTAASTDDASETGASSPSTPSPKQAPGSVFAALHTDNVSLAALAVLGGASESVRPGVLVRLAASTSTHTASTQAGASKLAPSAKRVARVYQLDEERARAKVHLCTAGDVEAGDSASSKNALIPGEKPLTVDVTTLEPFFKNEAPWDVFNPSREDVEALALVFEAISAEQEEDHDGEELETTASDAAPKDGKQETQQGNAESAATGPEDQSDRAKEKIVDAEAATEVAAAEAELLAAEAEAIAAAAEAEAIAAAAEAEAIGAAAEAEEVVAAAEENEENDEDDEEDEDAVLALAMAMSMQESSPPPEQPSSSADNSPADSAASNEQQSDSKPDDAEAAGAKKAPPSAVEVKSAEGNKEEKSQADFSPESSPTSSKISELESPEELAEKHELQERNAWRRAIVSHLRAHLVRVILQAARSSREFVAIIAANDALRFSLLGNLKKLSKQYKLVDEVSATAYRAHMHFARSLEMNAPLARRARKRTVIEEARVALSKSDQFEEFVDTFESAVAPISLPHQPLYNGNNKHVKEKTHPNDLSLTVPLEKDMPYPSRFAHFGTSHVIFSKNLTSVEFVSSKPTRSNVDQIMICSDHFIPAVYEYYYEVTLDHVPGQRIPAEREDLPGEIGVGFRSGRQDWLVSSCGRKWATTRPQFKRDHFTYASYVDVRVDPSPSSRSSSREQRLMWVPGRVTDIRDRKAPTLHVDLLHYNSSSESSKLRVQCGSVHLAQFGSHSCGASPHNLDRNVNGFTHPFRSGETIGAGINMRDGTMFFTRNGKLIENAKSLEVFSGAPFVPIWPAVELRSNGAKVSVNFGQRPFLYTEASQRTQAGIEKALGKPLVEDEVWMKRVNAHIEEKARVEAAKAAERKKREDAEAEKLSRRLAQVEQIMAMQIFPGVTPAMVMKALELNHDDMQRTVDWAFEKHGDPLMSFLSLDIRENSSAPAKSKDKSSSDDASKQNNEKGEKSNDSPPDAPPLAAKVSDAPALRAGDSNGNNHNEDDNDEDNDYSDEDDEDIDSGDEAYVEEDEQRPIDSENKQDIDEEEMSNDRGVDGSSPPRQNEGAANEPPASSNGEVQPPSSPKVDRQDGDDSGAPPPLAESSVSKDVRPDDKSSERRAKRNKKKKADAKKRRQRRKAKAASKKAAGGGRSPTTGSAENASSTIRTQLLKLPHKLVTPSMDHSDVSHVYPPPPVASHSLRQHREGRDPKFQEEVRVWLEEVETQLKSVRMDSASVANVMKRLKRNNRDMVAMLQARELVPNLRDAPSKKKDSGNASSLKSSSGEQELTLVPELEDLAPGIRLWITKDAQRQVASSMWSSEMKLALGRCGVVIDVDADLDRPAALLRVVTGHHNEALLPERWWPLHVLRIVSVEAHDAFVDGLTYGGCTSRLSQYEDQLSAYHAREALLKLLSMPEITDEKEQQSRGDLLEIASSVDLSYEASHLTRLKTCRSLKLAPGVHSAVIDSVLARFSISKCEVESDVARRNNAIRLPPRLLGLGEDNDSISGGECNTPPLIPLCKDLCERAAKDIAAHSKVFPLPATSESSDALSQVVKCSVGLASTSALVLTMIEADKVANEELSDAVVAFFATHRCAKPLVTVSLADRASVILPLGGGCGAGEVFAYNSSTNHSCRVLVTPVPWELTLLQYILNTADLRVELDLIPDAQMTPEAKALHVHSTTAYMTSLVSSILSVARVPSVAHPVAATCYELASRIVALSQTTTSEIMADVLRHPHRPSTSSASSEESTSESSPLVIGSRRRPPLTPMASSYNRSSMPTRGKLDTKGGTKSKRAKSKRFGAPTKATPSSAGCTDKEKGDQVGSAGSGNSEEIRRVVDDGDDAVVGSNTSLVDIFESLTSVRIMSQTVKVYFDGIVRDLNVLYTTEKGGHCSELFQAMWTCACLLHVAGNLGDACVARHAWFKHSLETAKLINSIASSTILPQSYVEKFAEKRPVPTGTSKASAPKSVATRSSGERAAEMISKGSDSKKSKASASAPVVAPKSDDNGDQTKQVQSFETEWSLPDDVVLVLSIEQTMRSLSLTPKELEIEYKYESDSSDLRATRGDGAASKEPKVKNDETKVTESVKKSESRAEDSSGGATAPPEAEQPSSSTSSSLSGKDPHSPFVSKHLQSILDADTVSALEDHRFVPPDRSWEAFVCERVNALISLNNDIRGLLPMVNLRGNASGNVMHDFLSLCKQLLFEHTKLDYLHFVIDETATIHREAFPISIDRLSASVATRKEMSVFGQGLRELSRISSLALRTPFTLPPGGKPQTPFHILYENEKVVGFDGPYRAFFSDVCRELQTVDSPTTDLLVPTPNHVSSVGNNRELFTIAPSSSTPAHLEQFHFLGRMMGVALRTSVLLSLDLPLLFWRMFIGDMNSPPLDWSSLYSEIDSNFVDGLINPLARCESEEAFNAAFGSSLEFTVSLSDGTVKELQTPTKDTAQGRAEFPHVVTFSNRLEFTRLAKEARLGEFRLQIEAMREGFGTVVPLEVLSLFSAEEMRKNICGEPKVDMDLLKRHTHYSGSLTAESELIKHLWTVLEEFSEDNRRKFVQFVYAQQHLPSESEFKRRHLRLLVQELKGKKPDRMLPHASTCFFNLSLPMYSSIDVLRSNLLIAITSAPGFGTNEEERQLAQIS